MIFTLKTFNEFNKDASAIWQSVEKKSNYYLFQKFKWLSFWHEKVGSKLPIYPNIVAVFESHKPIAIFPFGIRKSYGARVLEFMGSSQCDYNTPLIIDEFSDHSNVKKIWNQTKKHLPKHDIILFDKMPDRINDKKNFLIKNISCDHIYNSYNAILPNTWEKYYKTIPAKVRNDSRRQIKRLTKKGNLKFKTYKNIKDYDLFVNKMIEQKRKRYKTTGAVDIFSKEAIRSFYKEIIEPFYDEKIIHLSVLQLDNEIIATHWGLTSNNRFYFIFPTYEAGKWGKYSPGRILQEELIKWSIRNKFKIFDFTIGNESYKKIWTNDVIKIFFYIKLNSIRGLLFIMVFNFLKLIKQNKSLRRFFMTVNKFLAKKT